jgi:hypothetical protein
LRCYSASMFGSPWWPSSGADGGWSCCSSGGSVPSSPLSDHLGLGSGELWPLRWWSTISFAGVSLSTAVVVQVYNMYSALPCLAGETVCGQGENLCSDSSGGDCGDACGCHFLLGGVVNGLIVSSPRPGETLSLVYQTRQWRRDTSSPSWRRCLGCEGCPIVACRDGGLTSLRRD